jgi:hypothetical protein
MNVAAGLSKIVRKQNENRKPHDDLRQKGRPDVADMPWPVVPDEKIPCCRRYEKRITIDFRFPCGNGSNGCILGYRS